jgi:hypothetical protein
MFTPPGAHGIIDIEVCSLRSVVYTTIIVAAGILVKKAFSILSGKPMNLAQLVSVSVSVKAIPWAF